MNFNRFLISLCTVLFLLIIANLLYIDYKLFNVTESKPTTSSKLTPTPSQEEICYSDCIEEFSRKIASLEAAITTLPTPKTQSTQKTTTFPSAKEFYIPLGNGSGNSLDWTDVAGIQAYIDPGNYTDIKAIYFEVTVNIPSANQLAWVRLYQNNEKYPVWNTELAFPGGSSQLLISKPITLDSGNKLYKVQLKTQLGYTTNISQARVRIVTK